MKTRQEDFRMLCNGYSYCISGSSSTKWTFPPLERGRKKKKKKGSIRPLSPPLPRCAAHLLEAKLQEIRFTAARRFYCICSDCFFYISSRLQLTASLEEQMSQRSATIHPNNSLGGQSHRSQQPRGLYNWHEKSTFLMSRRII